MALRSFIEYPAGCPIGEPASGISEFHPFTVELYRLCVPMPARAPEMTAQFHTFLHNAVTDHGRPARHMQVKSKG